MNHTLSNGLELLMFLANSAHAHKLSQIARDMELPKSHVHRLLQTLVEHKYVEQTIDKKYQIGVGALRLGHALLYRIPLRIFAMPVLQKAVDEIKLPMTLAVPFSNDGITIAYVSYDGVIRDTIDSLGSVLSSYSSACGKLFFAYMDKKKQSEIMKELVFVKRGPNTLMNKESLKKELAIIKKKGESISCLENGATVNAFALPIRNEDGVVVAALGVSGQESEIPKSSIKKYMKQLPKYVKSIEEFYYQRKDHE